MAKTRDRPPIGPQAASDFSFRESMRIVISVLHQAARHEGSTIGAKADAMVRLADARPCLPNY